jgi:hypothetical protein
MKNLLLFIEGANCRPNLMQRARFSFKKALAQLP